MERRSIVVAGAVAVAGAGLAVEAAYTRSEHDVVETLVELFSLSYEQNVPTWYATCLLFTCGLVLVDLARRADTHRFHWWLLAGGFFTMSLDETAEMHEQLGGLVGGEGVLYFDWVIPASLLVLVLGLLYIPFLRALPPRRRRQFVLAAAIYLGGAIGIELPLGWWTEHAGDDNTTYALIDWVEETLELAGASLFLLALLEHRDGARR